MSHVKIIRFTILVFLCICQSAYGGLKTEIITCSIIPCINGEYNSADATNGDIRCMQGHFADGSGFTWTIRFLDSDASCYGQQHYGRRDSYRPIHLFTASNGDIYYYNFENNNCCWVIGKWKDNEGDLYYAMISNKYNQNYLFIFDYIGFKKLERQITNANHANIISLNTSEGTSESIGMLLIKKGMWINTITLK